MVKPGGPRLWTTVKKDPTVLESGKCYENYGKSLGSTRAPSLSKHNCLSSCWHIVFPIHLSPPPSFLSPPKSQLTLSRHSLPSPGCYRPQEISGRNSLGWEWKPKPASVGNNVWVFRTAGVSEGESSLATGERMCLSLQEARNFDFPPAFANKCLLERMGRGVVVMAGDFWWGFYGIFHVYFTFTKSRYMYKSHSITILNSVCVFIG